MKYLALFVLTLLLLSFSFSTYIISVEGYQNNVNKIEMSSDLQILDVSDIFGGHITWVIEGEIAKELREAIGVKYNVNTIDLGTASHYFKGDLEKVVENNKFGCGYIGTIRITRADPLHGDTQGILNRVEDVEGLVGSVNSTKPITLKMLIRGEPAGEKMPVTSKNITLAPFYALVNNASAMKKFSLQNVKIEVKHMETLAGLGNFELSPGTFTLRLVLGQFFMASSGYVEYRTFDPINSPLVLFIVYLAAVILITAFNKKLKVGKENTLFSKKAKRFSTATKVALFFVYLALPLSGIWFMLITAVTVVIAVLLLKKIYSV